MIGESMLTKNTEIEIPADNPFLNDQLERKIIAENLTRLVQSTNQPFVISIEAPWGWGKTTFIEMWKAHLENLGHTCLYFNAWENDFVEDPLIAFIGEIGKALDEKETKGKIGKQLNKLQDIGGGILRRTIPFAVQLATQGILSQENVKSASKFISASGDEIAKFSSEIATEKIKQYEDDKKGIKEFREELAEFAKALSETDGNKTPLVFFIDELDRCRPDFSIALLERIKHVFNAEGIVFILGIDRGQIEQSIKSIYGQGMDSDGYLRRFIDYGIRLPAPTVERFCASLFDRFSLDETFKERRSGTNEKQILLETFTNLSKTHDFSLRVIEQCFTELNILLRTTPVSRSYTNLSAFMVTLHTSHPELYAQLRDGLSPNETIKFIIHLREQLDINHRFYWRLLPQIEAHILVNYIPDYEREEVISKIKFSMEHEVDDSTAYAQRIDSAIEQFRWQGDEAMAFIIKGLNLLNVLT